MKRNLTNEYRTRNFPDEDIEKIRSDHLNKIKEFKFYLDEWAKFFNQKFYEIGDDYDFAKENRSESRINNFSIKIKEFLNEDVSVIDDYMSRTVKSISNRLKGQKKSKGTILGYNISQNIEKRIDNACEKLKLKSDNKNLSNEINTHRSDYNLPVKKNVPLNSLNINQRSKNSNTASSTIKDFKGEISIRNQKFEKLQQTFDSIFANIRNNPKNLYVCIKTYNSGEKIFNNTKKFYDKYLSSIVEEDDNKPMLIAGSTTNIIKILSEMDRILFNQKVTISLLFFESLDEIYGYFYDCGLYHNINEI